MTVRRHRGELDGTSRHVAIVAARFNEAITTSLLEGALTALAKHGVSEEDIEVAHINIYGELLDLQARFAGTGRFDAVICLGAVVRGDTAHFDLVANEAARGIARVSLRTGVPVIFEVLATDTLAQAEARAGGTHGNKGWEAAEAALEMASLLDALPTKEPR
jgi:6,7-dimethyl-8-ribityllumazine synthase